MRKSIDICYCFVCDKVYKLVHDEVTILSHRESYNPKKFKKKWDSYFERNSIHIIFKTRGISSTLETFHKKICLHSIPMLNNQIPEAVSRGVPAPLWSFGTPLFNHKGGTRHPSELFSSFFLTTMNNLASDLVRSDYALDI